MPRLSSLATEAARALLGVLALPYVLVRLPSDDYVTSLATGGEFVRLNGTAVACFGRTPSADRRCRFLEQSHCEAAAAGCVWANPAAHRCVGLDDACGSASWAIQCRRMNAGAGCSWERPLDLRVQCRVTPAHAHAGARCDAVLGKKAGALEAIRASMRLPLAQMFAFGLGNVWLLQAFGSIDAVVRDGKPFVIGLFVLVAAAGALHRHSYGDA